MKKLLSILLCIALCIIPLPVRAAADEAALEGDIWDGSITQPTTLVEKDGVYYYEITKCSELAYVARTGGDWLGYNYILGNNLIMNDVELTWDEEGNCTNTENLLSWKPIGSSAPFSGTFDGAGYIVSGLYTALSSGWDYGGFFGRTNNAQIKNIDIINSYIATGKYNYETGGVIGECEYGTVENCSFSGLVRGRGYDAGGLIGSGRYVTVSSCRVTGVVMGTGDNVGGLAGVFPYSTAENCSFSGHVVSEYGSAGGLLGSGGSGNISNCHTTGLIEGVECVGGLVGKGGWSGRVIKNSSSNAVVSGDSLVGGFIGQLTGGGIIENCVSFGTVTGKDSVGGFSGNAGGSKIRSCAAFGNATATAGAAGGFAGKSSSSLTENCFAFGNASGTTYSGGFVGSCSGNISSCYSLGAATGTGGTGGFIGEDRRIWGVEFTLSNCYYLKDVGVNETLFGTSVAGEDTVGEIEGKSSVLLQTQATFTDWDFTKIWAISPDSNGGYPYLQWLENTLTNLPVSSVQISETTLTLAEGDYAYLTATVSPSNASDPSITWQSSNPSVATVTPAGKVVAISAGTADITVTTTDGGHTATCTVTVTERKPEEYKINSIWARDYDGSRLTAIPTGTFLASVSITNLASEGDTLVLLASYTAEGRYKGLMWVSVSDLPVGATIEVTLPIDNRDGSIAQLKAFTVASFSNPVPLGATVSFPVQ